MHFNELIVLFEMTHNCNYRCHHRGSKYCSPMAISNVLICRSDNIFLNSGIPENEHEKCSFIVISVFLKRISVNLQQKQKFLAYFKYYICNTDSPFTQPILISTSSISYEQIYSVARLAKCL